jgi:hypothetical protein
LKAWSSPNSKRGQPSNSKRPVEMERAGTG